MSKIDIYQEISKFLAITGAIVNLYLSIIYFFREGYSFYLVNIIFSISVLIYFILDIIKKERKQGL